MIDVAFTPAALRAADIAVVIDVLRATSTATQALASGYRRVLMTDTIERADTLRRRGRVIAGERNCAIVPGFDQGNSPIEAMRRSGDELVLATTNGTPAVVRAAGCSPIVLLGCLLNLDALVEGLADAGTEARIQIVCSGTNGGPALEDAYVAGRICAALRGPRSDAAQIAIELRDRCPSALEAMTSSANGQVLLTLGADDDIAHCARESVLATVGQVAAVRGGVATVVDGAATVVRMRSTSSAPQATARG